MAASSYLDLLGLQRHHWPSVRHCVAERTAFADFRRQLGTVLGVADSWWTSQLRVTSSSGWITLSAHRVAERRSELLVMQVRMGLYYVATGIGMRSQKKTRIGGGLAA
eukprot:717103-Pyramimonas_sp.AAC.1